MFIECVNCGFYVARKSKSCPNCGVSAPSETLEKIPAEAERDLTVTIAVVLAIIFSFALLYLRNDGKFDNFSELPVILALSLLLSLAFAIFISLFVSRRVSKREFAERFDQKYSEMSLIGIEGTINQRNFELDGKYRETEDLLKRAEISGSKAVSEKLRFAREMILTQIALYELQQRKINLIRLQNSLRPLMYQRSFSVEENQLFTEKVDEAITEIEETRQSLTNDYAIEFPAATQSAKQEFLIELDASEKSFERLRAANLARQASRVLREASPFQDSFAAVDENDLSYQSEVFNIETTLANFSGSFEELEREYAQSEAKIELERRFP